MPPKGPHPGGPGPGHGHPPEPMELDLEALARETEDMLRLRFLNRENASFRATEGGFVSLTYDGVEYPRIGAYRAFPFSDPERYISIREPGEKAREIGIIPDLRELDPETAELLRGQLALRYFTPIITKILDIKGQYGFAYFDVITDKGPCKFTIRNGGGSVINLSETRLILTDLDGNRFEVPDTGRLTPGELKKLDLYI